MKHINPTSRPLNWGQKGIMDITIIAVIHWGKTYPVICAWCQEVIHNLGKCKNSHGICEPCKDKELKKLDEYMGKTKG